LRGAQLIRLSIPSKAHAGQSGQDARPAALPSSGQPSRYGIVIGNAVINAFADSIGGLVAIRDGRYCVDLHERACASVSCGGNDRDGCAVAAPH
jgi:hypothetical protein